MSDLVINCQQLNKVYQDGDNEVAVLKGVDLTLKQGEMLAVVGSSGSGKSTLLHILGTLDNESSGKVEIKGQQVSKLNRKQQASFRNENLGFIYQFHHLLMEFTAIENVAMPLLIKGLSAVDATEKAHNMLDKVGLSHRSEHKPSALSGGERQRVAIARALVTEPALVLADEPTGNLDKQNAIKIYDLIKELNTSLKTSFVVVTHDLELADKLGKIAYLDDGKLAIKESQHVA
ncbi:lipoprotein-releasing ABC transporter ATP-binding protein LolD [Pseudoalteromonas shioyasakiensis]|uniref:lipoprotein-releasing ABC transporter ATP-binding protein LolD n=1 Tax=Pseudoalteromonas TaxID=53246 RepID=UPI000C8B150C|nr:MULTISPECIES: lipoprotein-releasing ABC transporter ATP-binding protein LolD [Pseudoalteromonas]MAD02618.1 lipoprotein-releasing system ATP-binding protein LolD [Pseudoalteromonas sp.]MCG9708956.1 lipoprotein-releasing ABC transporter ATP-binding protein LolD [Pseudoalteromonas sp. Isolate3]MCP4585251.1 lipoprotein-releasing ABC transporter ATP-binding protein LolD [Pseudoalteromonas sp.]MCQ8882826.1 lipoprotein-releasing ABC transporter ATP-binding protein LolD [Pseudoalteromonas shioyasaki|tara:strand:+ start:15449 stop:16147 length:699 start_codon:yes stop_codon:yes gene_type:complete